MRFSFEHLLIRRLFLIPLACRLSSLAQPTSAPPVFTRLEALPPPKISASAEAYPGGHFDVTNLTDSILSSEYASNGKGTNTFVEFDLAAPTRLAAFRHIDRNDPATVASSELIFLGPTNNVLATLPMTNVNERSGISFFVFPTPVTAQRVRWHVTALGAGLGTVGGAEMSFFSAGPTSALPTAIAIQPRPLPILNKEKGVLKQPLKVTLDYQYAETATANIRIQDAEPKAILLKPGVQVLDFEIPAASFTKTANISLETAGQLVASTNITLKPVNDLQIFLLPHSHVDIGYTALQADVAKKQQTNIETGLRLAQATAGYPEGARFKWNVEVLWPVDNYLRTATPDQRRAFIAAVRAGQIGLDAFYGNILTGLCRPEELLNLMSYATRLSAVCGVPIESAMISDVPGYTWSTVSAMAQAGVKYFSFAPNYFDRMGGTMKEWQNRPFWWKGPDGQSRVLCWCPSRGYALGHLIGDGPALARFIPEYLTELQTNSYPYDITYLRWNVHGDNGSPDEKLADVVRDWNEHHATPRLTISTTAEAFREFARRYGHRLPEFTGDYTPYWEDGAASSARETALNRASAARLVQSEILWAIRGPGSFPAADFQNAWRNILLYSEHTWGAYNSISEPDVPFVREQWRVKQAFALDADKESNALLGRAGMPTATANNDAIDVFNTTSWVRTDIVTLSPELSFVGDRVLDALGSTVPSQRLSNGDLVFLAEGVPPFAAKRFTLQSGPCPVRGTVRAEIPRLISPEFLVRIDRRTGAVSHLYSRSSGKELVDTNAPAGFNSYFYLPGSDVKGLQTNPKPRIRIKENGPLLASLLVESEAPGCKQLLREVRVIGGLDRVEFIDTVDKLPVRAKEGIHFGYAFDVPGATPRMDVGWAVVRPELDQIPAACKNWFSVQRWLDVSNDRFGVTWSSIDAPLVEVGDITANLVGSQTDPRVWIQHLQPSSTIYSWVMNNHWHTNDRADQEGPTVFRYALRAHQQFFPEEAARFGVECSQPLIPVRASGPLQAEPRLRLSSDKVLVTALKPSDDGKGWVVRLFGASGNPEKVRLTWSKPAPHRFWLSDLSERPKERIGHSLEVPAWGIITIRAE